MQILENKAAWSTDFKNHWLAHLQETGKVDWSRYAHPRNSEIPGGPGVRLADSRLLLITSAGAYLPASQPPYDVADKVGDYSLRLLPAGAPFSSFDYAHGHYPEQFIRADPEVGIPLPMLRQRVEQGAIGSLAPTVVSIMGYQPDAARVIDETIPPILALARREKVQAALLAPL